MDRRIRLLLVLLTLALAGCAAAPAPAAAPASAAPAASATPSPTATPAPTLTPTSAPTATPTPIIARGVFVAGVDLGGKTPDEARALLSAELSALLRPIDVRVASAQQNIQPDDISLALDTDTMIGAALAAKAGAKVPLSISVDRTLLEQELTALAKEVDQPAALKLITATKSISRSFSLQGGMVLDVPGAAEQIIRQLQSAGAPRRITLSLTPAPAGESRPTAAELQEQIELMAEQWNGVVGVYVYDLAGDQVVAQLNQDTVFSGASVMKVAIMLNAYLNIAKFSKSHETWLRMMIVDSDNYSANSMLAASVGGSGTEDALAGVLGMSKMLSEKLGLKHTYQNMPYESRDYLVNVRGIKIRRGPAIEGPAPHTDADPVLRTTPAEMSSLFLWIEQCRKGEGPLLEKFDQLTAARCAEMIKRLESNGDKIRMRSGLPKDAVVAHKSGWIEDMQSDVGIVRSPGGDFLVAIYVYRDIRPTKVFLTDEVAAPVIGHFARLIYSYYNPVRVAK